MGSILSTALSQKKKTMTSQVLVAHACNPSYSGGRDLEDCDLKPAQANNLPHLEKTKLKNWAGKVVQVVEHLPTP
jgi:hypothetical protein